MPLVVRVCLALLLAACDGRGAEAVNEAAKNFSEAMRIVVVFFLILSAIGAVVYLSLWTSFIRRWRAGRASRTVAVSLVAIHVGALLLAHDDPEVHRWLWWAGLLPAAALAVAFAERLPLRLLVGAAAMAGMFFLPVRPLPLRALPGEVVDVSSAFGHACVVLRGGAMVCQGSVADACDDAAMRFEPAVLPAVRDATRVHTALGLRCIEHGAGKVTCCGGPAAMSRGAAGPWELPVDRPVTALSVTDDQILARAGDELFAWPHPLPEGLRTARSLANHDGIEAQFAVVDAAGTLWIWRQDDAQQTDVTRFEGVGEVAEVAVQEQTGACVRRADGAVTCFPWPGRGERREVAGLRAAQLVALDDPFGTFCARTDANAVVCWEDDDPPAPFVKLPTATRLVATSSALCDVAAAVRCAPVSRDLDTPLAALLALPVER